MSAARQSKVEKEKQVQDKVQAILGAMLRDEDNKYCVDCDNKGPRWASWNLGVFLCIRCAGIHRNLGVHISRVKSVNLDSWTPPQVSSMQVMGNSKARAVYEANLPEDFKRPQTDSAVESFVRQKYEKKKFVAGEWVATKAPETPAGWLEAGQETVKTKTEPQTAKKLVLPTPPGGGASPRLDKPAPAKPAPVSPRLTVALPPPTSSSATTEDLLGLSLTTTSLPIAPPTSSASSDLLGLNSEFSDFVSAPSVAAPSVGVSELATNDLTSLDRPEASVSPSSNPPIGKMSTDSIMALFGSRPAAPAMFPPSSSTMFTATPVQGANLVNNPFMDPSGANRQPPVVGLGNQFTGLSLGTTGGVNLPNNTGLGLWQ